MNSTDWILIPVLLALLLFIIIRRLQTPQSADVDLAVGVFMLIVAACCFATGQVPTKTSMVIDRVRDPAFFWIFIIVCTGGGLVHITKFVLRARASPRR